MVNNGGTIRRAPAVEYSDADWDHVIEVNLRTQFVLTREVGRRFVERRAGKVVFTASLLSFQGRHLRACVHRFEERGSRARPGVCHRVGDVRVTVNAVAPGYIRTDNTAALQADVERTEAIRSRVPVGRWGTPGDLAGATVFLASPALDYVTGIVLPVDGGWLAR